MESGSVRHVGFTESIQMIGDAMGWKLDEITDDVSSKIAEKAVTSEWLSVAAGQCGHHSGWCRIRKRGTQDHAEARGVLAHPRPTIRPHRRVTANLLEDRRRRACDIATASIAVNSIPAILSAAPDCGR